MSGGGVGLGLAFGGGNGFGSEAGDAEGAVVGSVGWIG